MTNIILTLLVIILILSYWFFLYVKATLYSIFTRYQHFSAQSGLVRKAKIVGVKVLSENGRIPLLECELEFPNFSGELIKEKVKLGDSKPNLKRFEPGKEVEIFLNRDSKFKSPVSMKGLNVGIKWMSIAFYTSIGGLYLYLCLRIMNRATTLIWSDIPIYEELLSNMGLHWMFLGFIGLILFNLFILRLFGFGKLSGKKKDIHKLRYYGLKSMGHISKYEDSGMMINDNPVVRFYYTFKGSDGQIHQGNDQILIGKLEVGKVPNMREKSIYYLPDSPEISLFEENLMNPSSINNTFLRGIFMLVGFILSAVIIGIFLSIIW